jgi:hypothetical protein
MPRVPLPNSCMATLRPRNRIVIFRLTEDEYEKLRTACLLKGGRSPADYARAELLALLGCHHQVDLLEDRLSVVDQILSDLHSTARHINQLLEHIAAQSTLHR